MLSTISGIPAHPLLVHLPVVGIPAAALLAIIAVFLQSPRFGRFRMATTAVAIIALISIFPARMSGEELLASKGFTEEDPGPVAEHAQFANYSLAAIIALVVLLVLFTFVLHRRKAQGSSALSWILGVCILLASIAAIVTTVLTGHEGALLVWNEMKP